MQADREALFALERKFWQSMVDQDTDAALAVLGDKVVGASSIEGAVRESDLLIVATGWPEYKEIDPAWCKRTNGQRLTVLDLWRTLPADKFADVADVLYLGSGR